MGDRRSRSDDRQGAGGVEFAAWDTPVAEDAIAYSALRARHSPLPIALWSVARWLLPPPYGRHPLEISYLSRDKLAAVDFRFADHSDDRWLSRDMFARLIALADGHPAATKSTFKVRGHPRETPTHALWTHASHVGEWSYIIADTFGGGHEIVSDRDPDVALRPVDILEFDGWPGVVVRDGPRTDAGELAGFDCVWLACDTRDQVAALITVGQGPIPVSAVGAPIDVLDIEERLLALAPTGSARLRVPHGGGFDEFSERGLYVYDWIDAMYFDSLRHRPKLNAYEGVTLPTHPITLSDLPAELRAVAALTRFDCDFAAAPTLAVEPGQT